MNETEKIFLAIMAFGIGYAIAYFFKNMGKIWKKYGALIGILLFPAIIISLVMAAAQIGDMRDVFVSTIFAAGFVVRMVKRDG